MRVIPPTPALTALNQALASEPINRLTPEAARAQVAEHRAETEVEFYRHPRFTRNTHRTSRSTKGRALKLGSLDSISYIS